MTQNERTAFLPKDNGASDLQDSVRLAGICKVFRYPNAYDFSMLDYIVAPGTQVPLRMIEPDDTPGFKGFDKRTIVRHPQEYKFDASRDQWICASAGLAAEGLQAFVTRDLVNGIDFMSPAVSGHEKRCRGIQANWFEDLWLRGEIFVHSKFTPTGEPNQLLCMLMIHPDKKYLKMWCDSNVEWEKSILEYWAWSYRNEPQLAQVMISRVRSELDRYARSR